MSLLRNRTTAILVAAGLLVGGANLAAYAANGRPLLLGKINKETRSATVKNTGAGPALKLKTRRSAPPLAVNSSKKVTRLNADKLDGLNAKALQTHSRIYSLPPQAGVSDFAFDMGLAPGVYQVSFSVVAAMSATGATINCYLQHGSGYELLAYGSTYLSFATSNASGIIDTRTAPRTFTCFTTGGNATINPASQIVATRIDGLSTGTLTPAARKPAPRVGGGR